MEQNVEYRQQMVEEYRAAAEPLFKYLPWMEKNAGRAVSRNYQGNGLSKNSMSFPVYEATREKADCGGGTEGLGDSGRHLVEVRAGGEDEGDSLGGGGAGGHLSAGASEDAGNHQILE